MNRLNYEYSRSIFDSIPPYYREYVESEQYIQSSDKEFERYYKEFTDFVNQFYIVSATWGLDFYEEVFDIPKNELLDDDERRRRILALLAGAGTSTVANLEAMLNQLVGVEGAEITEHNENYSFDVSIPVIDNLGVSDAARLLEIYKPAHLAFLITTYMTNVIRVASTEISGEETTVYPYHLEDIQVKTESKKGSGLYTQEIIEIKTEVH